MRIKVSLKSFFALVLLSIGIISKTSAADTDDNEVFFMNELSEPDSVLVIELSSEDGTKALDGVQLSLKKIADLNVENGSPEYTVSDEVYRTAGSININDMDLIAYEGLALKLSAHVKEYDYVSISGKDGRCEFPGLKHGLYLVCQTGKSGMSEAYSDYVPYIVSVPQAICDTKTGLGSWKYDVVSYPKTSVKEIPQTPPPNHETGDRNNPELFFIVATVSLMMSVYITLKRKTKEK